MTNQCPGIKGIASLPRQNAVAKPTRRDNGQPGLRRHYHENYYGAFILDPDGHNIEAVATASKGSRDRASA
jgi:hypothetical protein